MFEPEQKNEENSSTPLRADTTTTADTPKTVRSERCEVSDEDDEKVMPPSILVKSETKKKKAKLYNFGRLGFVGFLKFWGKRFKRE